MVIWLTSPLPFQLSTWFMDDYMDTKIRLGLQKHPSNRKVDFRKAEKRQLVDIKTL